MANTKLNTRIRQRIDTTANWTTNSSTVLANGELGFERTTSGEIKFKVGDGVKTWAQLSYVADSSASQSSQGGGDGNEIYIGTTEPNGYKVWINPEGDDDIASTFIVPITVTLQNNEPSFSSTTTYTQVLAQYNKDANIKCQGTMPASDGTTIVIDMPLISKVNYTNNENPITVFRFGQFANDEFIILDLYSNNTWEYGEMELGKTYTAGNGILINDSTNVISSRYGEPYSSIETLYTIDENSETDGPNTYISVDAMPDIGLAALNIMNLDQSIPIVIPEEGEHIEAIGIILYNNGDTREINMEITYDDEIIGTPLGYAGDINLAQLMDLKDEDDPEVIANFVSYVQSHPTNYLFANLQAEYDGVAVNQITFVIPITWVTSSSGNGEYRGVSLAAETTVGYPLPPAALRAGNGISIDSTTGAINVNYGQQTGTWTKEYWKIDRGQSAPSDYWIGQLYGWDSSGNYLSYKNSNTLPSYNSSIVYKMQWWYNHNSDNSIEKSSLSGLSISSSQTSIDYNNDNYYFTKVYYGEGSDDPNKEEIICNQLPYGNALYTYWDSLLYKDNSSNPRDTNIFFFGTYNCSQSFTTITTNGSMTPDNDSKPCFAIIVLAQKPDNNVYNSNSKTYESMLGHIYFTIISPSSSSFIEDKGSYLFDYVTLPKYKTLPNSILPQTYCEASGNYDIAIGYQATAREDASIAIGAQTNATRDSSVAIGTGASANGSKSISLGYWTNASGDYSVSIGSGTNAAGEYGVAIGDDTKANGQYSTAMGHNTRAQGYNSTAMGYNTYANGSYSITMGENTQANGTGSTAMGENTQANGIYSTAMGENTQANGIYSTAMGEGTVANSNHQLVIGKYNNNSSTAIFQIGNGGSINSGSNCFEIDNDGNAYKIYNGMTYSYWNTQNKMSYRPWLDSTETLSDVINAYNSLIQELKAAGLMESNDPNS